MIQSWLFLLRHNNLLSYFRNLGSLRYGNEYSKYGKIPFFPFAEAFFNHTVITARDWFV